VTKPGNSDRPEDTPETANGTENNHAVAPESDPPATSEPAEAKPAEPKPAAPKPVESAKVEPLGRRLGMSAGRGSVSGITGKPTPNVVRWGFYLVLTSALIAVVGSVWWLLDKNDLIQQQLDVNADREDPLTRDEVVNGVTNLLWVLLIANVVFGAFQSLFAWKAKDGLRRARMQLLIATVIIVLFHYLFAPTPHGLIAGLSLAIGTAMLYLPGARDYYPPRQRVR
jgi:hypothetical protein